VLDIREMDRRSFLIEIKELHKPMEDAILKRSPSRGSENASNYFKSAGKDSAVSRGL
jgi:hypothetical protein